MDRSGAYLKHRKNSPVSVDYAGDPAFMNSMTSKPLLTVKSNELASGLIWRRDGDELLLASVRILDQSQLVGMLASA